MDECPVEAIYPDMDVPDELQEWIELNEKAEDFPQLVSPKKHFERTQVFGSQRRSVILVTSES